MIPERIRIFLIGCLVGIFIAVFGIVPLANQAGKQQARTYHCHSLGFEEFRVTERGTIECIKVTREVVK